MSWAVHVGGKGGASTGAFAGDRDGGVFLFGLKAEGNLKT